MSFPSKKINHQKIIERVLFLIAFFTFFSTIYFIYNEYSGILFWDLWEVILDFYPFCLKGGWALIKSMFSQCNEHKSIFGFFFLWFDIQIFGGKLWLSLILAIISQAGTLSFLIYLIFQNSKISLYNKRILSCFTIILGFCWIQKENFTFLYQFTFLLVNLNVLLALFFLFKYSNEKKIVFYFLSLLLIFFASFSFGNGLIGAMVFILFAFTLKLKIKEITFLFLWVLFCAWLYFLDFKPVPKSESLFSTILNNFIDVLLYMIRILSASLYLMTNKKNYLFDVFGILLIILYLISLFKVVFRKTHSLYSPVLVAFLTFIMATFFAIAAGRLGFGIEGALASRYQSLVFLGCMTLAIFYMQEIKNHQIIKFIKIGIISICCILFFMPIFIVKAGVLHKNYYKGLNQKREFIAFRMGIHSPEFTKVLYPKYLDTTNYKLLIKNNVGRLNVLSTATELNSKDFDFEIENFAPVLSDTNFYSIKGWSHYQLGKYPEFIVLKHPKKKQIIGYAVVGFERPDIAQLKNYPLRCGFEGYIKDTTFLK